MDIDLEQDYISIVKTMREQINLLKVKVSNQQQGRSPGIGEEIERKEKRIKDMNADIAAMSEELRKLREVQRELISELNVYDPELIDADPPLDSARALEEVERLSAELSVARQEYSDAQARQRSQNPSPVTSRMNFISKKLSALTAENDELTDRVATLENERKEISELYTSLVERNRSEEKLKTKVRQLEQIMTEKDWELESLIEERKTVSNRSENSMLVSQMTNQLALLTEEKSQLEDVVIQLQDKVRRLEAAEFSALENSPIAQKLKSELKQMDLTLQGKLNMLKLKDQEFASYKAQNEKLTEELQFVHTEKSLFQSNAAPALQISDLVLNGSSLAPSLHQTPKTGKSQGQINVDLAKQTRSMGKLLSPSKVMSPGKLLSPHKLAVSESRPELRPRTDNPRSAAMSPYPSGDSYARIHAKGHKQPYT